MMCVSLCGRVYSGCLSQTGWCPLTFVSINRDWVLPPANDTSRWGGGGSGETSSSSSPHLGNILRSWARGNTLQPSVVPKTKNTTFSNVIMLLCLPLWSWCTATFAVGGEEGIIFVSVSLCVVLSCLKLIWFLCFGGGGGVCCGASWEGWAERENCHIRPVIWLWASRASSPLYPSFIILR